MRPMDIGAGGMPVAAPPMVPGTSIWDWVRNLGAAAAPLLAPAIGGAATLLPWAARHPDTTRAILELAKRYPDIFEPGEQIPELTLGAAPSSSPGSPGSFRPTPPEPGLPWWLKAAAGLAAGGLTIDPLVQAIQAMRRVERDQEAERWFPQEMYDRQFMATQQAFYDMKQRQNNRGTVVRP